MKTLLLSALAVAALATTASAAVTLKSARFVQDSETPQRAEEQTDPQYNYYNVTQSLEDDKGNNNPKYSVWRGNGLTVTLPADGQSGEAVIKGIYDYPGKYTRNECDVIGQYDAEAKTLTIGTYFNGILSSRYTKLNEMFLTGEWGTTVMVGCEVPDKPNESGKYDIETTDQVVFTMTDQGTLRCQGEWLIYFFGEKQTGIYKIFRDTELIPVTDEPRLVSRPSEFNFGDTFEGYAQTRSLFLANVGRTGGALQCNLTGDAGVSLVEPASEMDPLSTTKFDVTFNPETVGEFNGAINIDLGDATGLLSIPVTAQVAANDFSQIVKEGDFTFSTPACCVPFRVTDEYTGSPVAVTMGKQNSFYELRADFDVPEGYVGVLSWDGVNHASIMYGFMVYMDNMTELYNDINDNSHNGIFKDWPMDVVTCVAAGHHFLDIKYLFTAPTNRDDMYGYFGNLSLVLVKEQPNYAMLLDKNLEMGEIFHDKLASTKQMTVEMLNVGSESLQVTGSTGSDHFRALPGAPAQQSTKLPVTIEFTGDQEGDYDEILTIQTNAGDFELHCTAAVKQLPYDYSPIVAKGDFSFDTSDP